MADGGGGDRFVGDWVLGLKTTVLARAGAETATGGAEVAADLVPGFGWNESRWMKRLSQCGMRRWLAFFDEYDRESRPASKGDVISYIVYFSQDGKVGPMLARHFVTAVSRYHEDVGLDSPTITKLVKSFIDAYSKKVDVGGEARDTRLVCSATLVGRII